ncbi:diguanylate cyclase [Fulvimarina sp. MAC3]|uniref:diguanylate cyclase n=1 Tax=Fulvimarina sp. MAC3 TaxID=3148887 RepID=UPI0031FC099D
MKTYVIVCGVAVALPFLGILSGTIGYYAYKEKQERLAAGQQQNAELLHVVHDVVDAEIAALHAIAGSPAFSDGIDREMLAILAEALAFKGEISVFDMRLFKEVYASGERVNETLESVLAYDQAKIVAETKGNFVSNLLPSPTGKGYAIALSVPVKAGPGKRRSPSEDVRYVVTAFIDMATFADLLAERNLGDGYFGSLVDRTGRIIARTDRDAEKTGQILPGFSSVNSLSGTWSGVNPAGVEVYGFWTTESRTNWTLTTGISKSLVEAPIWASHVIVGSFALAMASALFAGFWFAGRRIQASCKALTSAADGMRSGRPVTIPTLPIHEANKLGAAIVSASIDIGEQAKTLSAQADALKEANDLLEYRIAERTSALSAALRKAEQAEEKAMSAVREMARLATRDALTGVNNRRYFDTALQQDLMSPKRLENRLSLLIVDVDHFKSINDRFGHHVGDDVLRSMADTLQAQLHHPDDALFRIGGEEFAILLPSTRQDQALIVANRIHDAVRAKAMHDLTPCGSVTVSIGIAMDTGPGESARSLYSRADKALYEAKSAGRNTTRLAASFGSDADANVLAFKAK